MLPGNVPSSIAFPGLYYDPDDRLTSPLSDWEMGGVAINDASQGLLVRAWHLTYQAVEGYVIVTPDGGSPTTLFTAFNIEEMSLAFDQNMRPAVAYRVGPNLFVRWFDTVVGNYVTAEFGEGRNPKLSLDDKRPQMSGDSDIIFGYMRNTSVCYRQQRDRFLTERVLRSGLPATVRLANIGLTRAMRLQFELAT